jgi:arylsulfatase A-like enzyme
VNFTARHAKGYGTLAAFAAVVFALVASRPGQALDPPPSVVVIIADDLRWDALQYMPITSQRLASEGLVFENAFVTTSLCCPSRVSFLTGRYAHNHGVVSNRGPAGGFPAFNDASTLATWLDAAGYTTSLIGKYMNLYPANSLYVPPGWDDWHANAGGYFQYNLNENGTLNNYASEPDDYSTDVFRDRAVEFVNGTQDPFFLWLSLYGPHPPQDPAPRHVGSCDGVSFARPPSYNEADVSDKPAWVQNLPLAGPARLAEMDVEDRQRVCTIKSVDEAVGAVLDALGPRLDDTVVILTSDNGLAWSEHRLRGKNCIYEECLRVPFIIRFPRLVSTPGTREQMALNIDLAPTIADLAGIQPGGPIDGQSLVPVLQDAGAVLREDFLAEYSPDLDDPSAGLVSAVRTGGWKYAEHPGGETELYDLVNDPFELDSLAGRPEHAAIEAQLRDRLATLRGEGQTPLEFTSTPNTSATAGQAYTYQPAVSGAGPIAWSLATSPAGMTIEGDTGALSWTPTSPGDVDVSLVASNGFGSATQDFTITVAPASVPPQITSTPVTTGSTSQQYRYQARASGDQPITWALEAGPAGMSITAGGLVTWMPAAAGNFAVRIGARNAAGSATQAYNVTVTGPTTLMRTVADARSERTGTTLVQAKRLPVVQTSNNNRLEIEAGDAYTFRFRATIPAGVAIRSVKLFVEHHEEAGFTPGSLLWRATLGTLAAPGRELARLRPQVLLGPSREAMVEWDVSAVVTQVPAANKFKLILRNESSNGKKHRIDRVWMVVVYESGAGRRN